MRAPLSSLVLVLAGVGCGGADDAVTHDAATRDAAGGACAALAEGDCLARSDCHAGYTLSPCENIFGYCAAFGGCRSGQADCLGPAACAAPTPSCGGPYVISYVGACYGPCVRADQCAGCQTDKLAFTQASGCANDGSVEFCAPPALVHAFATLAPTVRCVAGVGRAGCDPATEQLCSFPTDASTCTTVHGALTDAAWDTICGLTMLPEVTRIVPTILE